MSVLDMSPFIAPKSAQLTADDLLAGDRTITITGVELSPGAEQPCRISFDGDQGKPWFPCKSMGRVMVKAWGPDAKQYVGKSVQLFRDPDVTWGGMKIGGIRIRALSHIDAPFDMALTATRGKKAMSRFFPLKADVQPLKSDTAADKAKEAADKIIANIAKAPDAAKLSAYLGGKPAAAIADWRAQRPELAMAVDAATAARLAELTGAQDDDPFGDDPFADDETPAYAATVEQIERMIAEARDADALELAQDTFNQHRPALPDNIVADLDAQLVRKGSEVRG